MECIGHGWGFQAEPSADISSRFYSSTVDILDLLRPANARRRRLNGEHLARSWPVARHAGG